MTNKKTINQLTMSFVNDNFNLSNKQKRDLFKGLFRYFDIVCKCEE
jgi:nucleoside recognition membrane protein YjiH